MKPDHVHDFKPQQKTTNLHAFRRQAGKVEMVSVNTARDILKQRVCECGEAETYDLKREVLHKP
jgi:hypothetical protein